MLDLLIYIGYFLIMILFFLFFFFLSVPCRQEYIHVDKKYLESHTLKDDAVKLLHSICQKIWKTQPWPQDWKRSVFIPIPKRGNAKECLNYHTIALISYASKIMLKILQARLQQYMNCELPDIQAGLRKGRGTEIKLPTSIGSSKKQESSRKTSTSALLTMPKPLTVWITTNCGKFLKRWEYQIILPAS